MCLTDVKVNCPFYTAGLELGLELGLNPPPQFMSIDAHF